MFTPEATSAEKMRVYVATNWADVVEVLGYRTEQDPYFKGRMPRRFVRVLFSNGDEQREVELPLNRSFTALVGGTA